MNRNTPDMAMTKDRARSRTLPMLPCMSILYSCVERKRTAVISNTGATMGIDRAAAHLSVECEQGLLDHHISPQAQRETQQADEHKEYSTQPTLDVQKVIQSYTQRHHRQSRSNPRLH